MVHRATLLSLLALGAVACGCSAPGARVHLGYMQSQVSGELALAPSSGLPLTSPLAIDVESGLGLDEPAPSVLVRAELDAGPVRVTASAFQYSESGSGTLTSSFGNIPINADVDSDLDFVALKTAATFDILDLGPVRISPGIGVDLFDMKASVTERLTQTTEDVDELFPIPMLFLQGEVEVGPVGAIVDIGGMDVGYGDFSGTFIDIEALVYYEPVEHVEVFAGYRWISLDADGTVDDQDFVADLVIQGWFLGGGVSF
ncbi:MAG: hypothetical protein IPM29_32250 [Planctomycetes bacterium]|nr:hypothetical protein [Planctomycetota bacterium]